MIFSELPDAITTASKNDLTYKQQRDEILSVLIDPHDGRAMLRAVIEINNLFMYKELF
jgi:hypothetical protein